LRGKVKELGGSPRHGDSWPVDLGYFNRSPDQPKQTNMQSIIQDDGYRVEVFAHNVDSLWSLGHKE
jgi:hypothetical protein